MSATNISFHAAYESWEKRGDGRSIREAFMLASLVEYKLPNGAPAYPDAETFLYAPGDLDQELVFIVRDGTVVTVTPPRGRAIPSRNLSNCPCCDGVHEFVADCGCPWCSASLERIQRGDR